MADYEGTMNEEGVIEATELVPVSGAAALEAVDRAAIDVQISTAKAYPRSVESFRREALELATLDEETAASCFYAIPRAGKTVEGPSVRLAEIAAYSWGNIRVDARIQAVEEDRVVAVGTAFDAERNSGSRVEIPRSILDRNGKRYKADMINVTCRAAIAIARREAILAVIPRAYVNPIYHAARKASLGEGGTMEQKRQKALAWFAKLGVSEERVYHALQIKGLADLGEDELITLRGIMTAIRDGETTAEQAFPRPGSVGNEDSKELNELLRKGAAPVETDAGPRRPDTAPAAATEQGAGGVDSMDGTAAQSKAAPDDVQDHFWEKSWRLDEPPAVLEYLADQLAAIRRLDTLDRLEEAERAGQNRKTALTRIEARRRLLENGKGQPALGIESASDEQISRIKALLEERAVEDRTALGIYQQIARAGFNEPDAADVIAMLEELPEKVGATA
jgi:hypothetical protein